MTSQEILQSQLLLSSLDCRPLQISRSTPASKEDVVLSGIIPHLQFTLELQSNSLTYQGNPYTKYQQFLYALCKQLHDKGYGYRRIAKMINKWFSKRIEAIFSFVMEHFKK